MKSGERKSERGSGCGKGRARLVSSLERLRRCGVVGGDEVKEVVRVELVTEVSICVLLERNRSGEGGVRRRRGVALLVVIVVAFGDCGRLLFHSSEKPMDDRRQVTRL